MALARRHWRFVVRDRYGFTVQNARVYVYQPGTTNAFIGTAYDAASGGNVVTNPRVTNAQGEAEAWFDTDQSVDVFVDDNTDTAYRAVDGSGVPFSFTAFTEKDEIFLQPEDIADIENLPSAYVTTILADAAPLTQRTAAAIGASTQASREDHVHSIGAALGKTAKFTTASDTNEQLVHTLTVPANTLAAGSMFRVVLKGYQTNGTTACTYTFRVRFGGLAGTQIFSIAFVGTTTAHTDNPVHLEFLLTVQSIGATGTIVCSVSGDECITTAVANTPKLVLDAQAAAVTVDTTANKDLVLTVQMNTTTGTPNLEVDNVLIEQVA